jgi:mannosyltransferase
MNTHNTTPHKLALPASFTQRMQHLSLLALVLLLGATLRIYDLGAESYWLDEAIMIQLTSGSTADILAEYSASGRPPVYVWLTFSWVQIFGASEAAARALSALIGSGAILAIYYVGKELFGRHVGLSSALLMALSEMQIFHAQNLRYYSLVILLTLISFLYYIRMLRTGSLAQLTVWAITNLLLFFTHFLTVLVFPAQVLHFLIFHRRYRSLWLPWALAQASLAVAATWHLVLPLFQRTVVEGGPAPGPSWIPPTELSMLYRTVREYLLSTTPLRETIVPAVVVFVVGLLLFWLVQGPARLRRSLFALKADLRRFIGNWPSLLLVSLWLIFPPLSLFGLSLLLRPMFVDRYTLSAAPALYLLIAGGLWSVRRLVPTTLVLVAFMVLTLPGIFQYYQRDNNEQWREVATYVAAAGRPGDAVVLGPGKTEQAWYWYYQGEIAQCGRGEVILDVDLILAITERCTAEHPRVWLVLRDTLWELSTNDEIFAHLTSGQEPALRILDRQDFVKMRLVLLEKGS